MSKNSFQKELNSLTKSNQIKPSLKLEQIDLFIKRIMDILISILILPIAIPLIVLIAITMKIEDPKNSIFFIQKRMGKSEKSFNCIKFRTMKNNSDKIFQNFLNNNKSAREEWDKYKKLKSKDPRVTKIGKILRKSSLDELPQLINVLTGDMSLVGPRPSLFKDKIDMGSYTNKILQVKPGITGLWQVSGRNKIAYNERLKMDEWYADNRSIRLDLKLFLKTIIVVFKGEGAH